MGWFLEQIQEITKEKDNSVSSPEITEEYIEPDKQVTKQEAKKMINRKFIIGNVYMLRQKPVCGSKGIIKKFILKKFIYTVKGQIINVLILKQISGPQNTIFTLNHNDCKRYHIKYEPGLQVFPMHLNWISCKK